MANREETQDSEGLDLEEIESSPAPRRLRSRPKDLIQIDSEEVEDNPPPRARPMIATSSGGGDARDSKKLQLAVLGILGVLLLSNLIVIYQISSVNNKIDKISSNLSQFMNGSLSITKDLKGNLTDSEKLSFPVSKGIPNVRQTPFWPLSKLRNHVGTM